MASAPEVSIIVPAYNAARVLKDSVLQIERQIKKTGIPYEILIVENASTDTTPQIAAELAKKREVRHLTSTLKGRGRALNKGFTEAKGTYIVYTDADLDIPLKYIFKIVHYLKEGYDIAVASKRHPQSRVGSPLHRRVLSKGYGFLVRSLLHSTVHDHQGGLKGFRKDVIMSLLTLVEDNKWFWDTEVLVLAQWKSYTIKEVPITADYGFGGTTVVLKDCTEMFSGIMKLRSRQRRLKRILSKKGRAS